MPKVDEKSDVESGGNNVPRCSDYDDDCFDVECYLNCYLYDPAKGYCPFLRQRKPKPWDGGA